MVSEAEALPGAGVPLEQESEMFTVAPLFGMKSFDTVKRAAFCELTIVQAPLPDGTPLMAPRHVPLVVYPGGTGDSVAVQLAPGA